MSHFAKLFERDGKQVLVLKSENEDGDPALEFRFLTDVEEHSVTIKVTMKKDSALDEFQILDRAFDAVGEERAFEMRNSAPGVHL